MRNKAQVGVLSVVLLTGIVLSIVSVTYLWGQPLIEKNVDKSHINAVLEKLDEIDDAIQYTINSGSNTVIDLDLSDTYFIIDSDNNRLIVETFSSVPMISSVEEVPINYYELSKIRESLSFNTTYTYTDNPLVSGYNSLVYHTNYSFSGVLYNVTIHQNTISDEWDLVCIWRDSINSASDCAKRNEALVVEGVTLDIVTIITDGTRFFALGDYIENDGVLGSEPTGIISGKSASLADKEQITFYLTYRSMISASQDKYVIVVSCSNNCATSDNNKQLVISRDNVVRNSDSITTYVKLEIQ